MNTTYTYYLTIRCAGESITCGINGTEAAYAAYRAAIDLIDKLGCGDSDYVNLVWGDTGEVVASLASDEEDEDWDDAAWHDTCDDPDPDDPDWDDCDLEVGFDPYLGDYTWDC